MTSKQAVQIHIRHANANIPRTADGGISTLHRRQKTEDIGAPGPGLRRLHIGYWNWVIGPVSQAKVNHFINLLYRTCCFRPNQWTAY